MTEHAPKASSSSMTPDVELAMHPQDPSGGPAFTFSGIEFAIQDKRILQGVSGSVSSGQIMAVLGPSGAGKSTLLDILARRNTNNTGVISYNDSEIFDMRDISSYVEQNDALIGVLSVAETIRFAARLSLPADTSKSAIEERVQITLKGLGLTEVAGNRIGTPIQRGVSGGQRRRVTIGCSVVTRPRILFLDEPTSGLDSSTSRQVVNSIKNMARQEGTIVLCTIHQPNYETFKLFDKVLILANGKSIYSGDVEKLPSYFETLEQPCPVHTNPADHAIDLIAADFERQGDLADEKAQKIDEYSAHWERTGSHHVYDTSTHLDKEQTTETKARGDATPTRSHRSGVGKAFQNTGILVERNLLNYSRNLLAYGVRLGMYLGMGVLLATIWVNLAQTSTHIDDRLSVFFFSVAFLGFMSVAGIPAFLEERSVFVRERMNGLYGPGAYVLANSIVTAPFLFICSLVFTVLCYWSIGLHPGAGNFFRFTAVLFLAVYTAESQSVLVAAIIPIFVAALAIASFMNGFWMCVQGYFIRAVNLPRFWYDWAHWIDYQTYAFNILTKNDLTGLVFSCSELADGSCHCNYPSSLQAAGQCAIKGEDVLNALGINGINVGLYAGILLIIALFFRVALYVVLVFKKR